MFDIESVKKIIAKFPTTSMPPVAEKTLRDPEPEVLVPATLLRSVAEYVKTEPSLLFDLPNFMTAIDYIKEDVFELVYYFYSTTHKKGLVLKVRVPRRAPSVVSLTDLWPGFDFQEREAFDLFGIHFEGHPNLKRIMMWDGFPGHPLKKDYVHVTDAYDSGLEIGTPGLDEKGIPKISGGVADVK